MKHITASLLLLLICSVICEPVVETVSQKIYTPPNLRDNSYLWEPFDESWSSRWVVSADPKYTGVWSVEQPIEGVFVGIEGDNYLVAKNESHHHGIATSFTKPLKLKQGAELVIQYEFRAQETLVCGGAYVKLLAAGVGDLKQFNDKTNFVIMFGPDRCGDSKIHFILKIKNPVTGEYVEHHMKDKPAMKPDTMTHLYSLHINTNSKTFTIFVDGEEAREGTFAEDFEPSIQPPVEIDDPTDKMPADWVTEAKIPDPTATKPEDWDENAPRMIVDPEDSKPEGWLDTEPATIPDPEAKMPEEWNIEEDGEWVAPMIDNPKCADVGCGEFKPGMIVNPEYKGKWRAPMIDNPAYIGEWHPKKIKNPAYYQVADLTDLPEMSGLGIEIWTINKNLAWDNILVTEDSNTAIAATNVWGEKHLKEKSLAAAAEGKKGFDLYTTLDDILGWLVDHLGVTGTQVLFIGSLIFIVLLTAYCCVGGKSKSERSAVLEEEHADEQEEGEAAEEEKPEEAKAEEAKPVEETKPVEKKTEDKPAAAAASEASEAPEEKKKKPSRKSAPLAKPAVEEPSTSGMQTRARTRQSMPTAGDASVISDVPKTKPKKI